MREINDLVYDYIANLYIKQDDSTQKLLNSMAEHPKAGQALSPVESKFLQILIRAFGIQNILEIGCFYGFSASQMAQAIPKGGRILSLEKNEEFYKIAKENLEPWKDKIVLRNVDAVELLQDLDEEFDMVFIDANKAAYPKYLDWAENYIRTGGLIVADNTLLNGLVLEEEVSPKKKKMWQAMREFNQRLADTKKFDSILLPFKEGLSIAIKK